MTKKYLSRWTLAELIEYLEEHNLLFILSTLGDHRITKRSYYEAVRRDIRRNRSVELRQQPLVWLAERVRRENIPLPEDGSGKGGRVITKDYIAAITRFYEPDKELKFDEVPIEGEKWVREWTMVVPHSKEKDVNVFFRSRKTKD